MVPAVSFEGVYRLGCYRLMQKANPDEPLWPADYQPRPFTPKTPQLRYLQAPYRSDCQLLTLGDDVYLARDDQEGNDASLWRTCTQGIDDPKMLERLKIGFLFGTPLSQNQYLYGAIQQDRPDDPEPLFRFHAINQWWSFDIRPETADNQQEPLIP